jgi:predicted N-acetyltransferase YhbS
MTNVSAPQARPDDRLEIRPGYAADAAALSAVARESKALWGYSRQWLDRWRADLTISAEDIDRMIVRVAVLDGVIAGFGAIQRLIEGWELAHLWVHPSYGRQGVGTRLLADLGEAARAAGAERLSIVADPHAVPFYRKAGAVGVGEVAAPMPGAEARVLVGMSLELER